MKDKPTKEQSPSPWGYFSKDGKEYYITNPKTPRPWFNLISSKRYGIYLSQVGGGFSIFHPQTKITQYTCLEDSPGKWLYVRDDDSGDFWTVNWHPVQAEYEEWQGTFGMGYSVMENRTKGIRTTMTIFVPQRVEDPVDVWIIKVKNESKKKRRVSFFPYQEWRLSVSSHADNETQWFSLADWFPKEKAIVAEYRDPLDLHAQRRAFIASSLPVLGYECRRNSFLGHFSYNTFAAPDGVCKGKLANSRGKGDWTCGVLHNRLTLEPGEEKTFQILVGFAPMPAARKRLMKKYLDTKTAAEELEAVKKYWTDKTSKIWVETPDPVFNRMTNYWAKHQAYQCARWCRSASFRYGYRDVNQDIRGVVSLDPAFTRRRFIDLLQYQFKDGHCVRQWSGDGNHDYRDYRDSPYWIVYTLAAYLKETGDLSILKEKQRYLDGGEDTVYGHALKAMRNLWNDRGYLGQSHMGGGDINDSLDMIGHKGKGVSTWLSTALHWGLVEMEQIALLTGDKKVAAECKRNAARLKKDFNKCAWDGEWWLRAFDDNYKPVGSKVNKEGRIHLNVQSWAVLSGISTHKRDLEALDAVDKYLDSPFGPKTFTPPYTKLDEHLGKFTTLPSNGNVYVHSTVFVIGANLVAGRSNRGFEILKALYPTSDKFKTTGPRSEPIAFPNSYRVLEKPRTGEGTFGWLTGSASWLFFMSSEWIPGATPDYHGLRIDPRIPSKWKELKVRRPFRGAVYQIHVRNPKGVQAGVKSITVDGKPLKGNLIPPHGDGKTHKVEVVMG